MTDHIDALAEKAARGYADSLRAAPMRKMRPDHREIQTCNELAAAIEIDLPPIIAAAIREAAAQSRILALEGALREILETAGDHAHWEPHAEFRYTNTTDCPGCKAIRALAPQPQASGGEEKDKL